VSAPEQLAAQHLLWLKEERARLRHQLDVLSSGACRLGYNAGNGWVDTTSEMIEGLQQRLQQLDGLIGAAMPPSLRR
jgi:hypothetical protein